jgi:hypothetical protein
MVTERFLESLGASGIIDSSGVESDAVVAAIDPRPAALETGDDGSADD